MTFSLKRKDTHNSQKITTLWVSDTQPLDSFLHKVALLNIVRQFAELGHKVTLIAVRSKNVSQIKNPQAHIILFPLRFVPVVSPIMFAIAMAVFLPVFIIISKPDCIVIEFDISILGSLPGLLISSLKKAKLVLDIRSIPVEMGGFRGFLHSLKFSASVLIAKKLFDGITILTPLMKKEVCNRFDLNPNKVGVWTSGVSQSLFNPQNLTLESAELEKKLELTGKFVVFYHGALTATRGLRETIEAIKILTHKHSNIVFFLLGTGPIAPMLRNLILEESLQDNVIIHNPVEQSDVPKFIGMCDVGIVPLPYHPYWRFQSPLKLLEYLSMEKVVILTDIPAHRLIVDEKKCAIYISSIKPIEIAKSIEYAYLNKDKLREWGKVGRTIIEQEYTWEKVARDLENYLLSIDKKVD